MQQDIRTLDKNFAPAAVEGEMYWYDARDIGVEGQGWSDTAHPYDRFPAKAETIVRDHVWTLSKHSAGMCVRFVTNSPKIAVRWTLRNYGGMSHMPNSGISGVDLYVEVDGNWRWAGVGIPNPNTHPSNEAVIFNKPQPVRRHFMLYLPLYNGVETMQIGFLPDATLSAAPAWPGDGKPIVFYGTSITQGGCASRPGMAYPAMLGRRLKVPTINLGFSGNGPMDLEVAPLLAELDASVYVLDCLPNMQPQMVTERAEPFVTTLRAARPETPIVLVENIVYQSTLPDVVNPPYMMKNGELRAAYERLLAAGIDGLHYIPGDNLLGDDWESTVDGTHPNDLGFHRMANEMKGYLRAVV